MTVKEAATALGCSPSHVYVLVHRNKLKYIKNGISAASVKKYASTRRLKRKTFGSGFISARRLPKDLVDKFRAAIPGGSNFILCLAEAIEMWLKSKEKA